MPVIRSLVTEEITRDVPNVSVDAVSDLDDREYYIRIGAEVHAKRYFGW